MRGLTYSRRLFRRATFADVGTLMHGSLVNQNHKRQSRCNRYASEPANGKVSPL